MKVTAKQILEMYRLLSTIQWSRGNKLPWSVNYDIKHILKEIKNQQPKEIFDTDNIPKPSLAEALLPPLNEVRDAFLKK